jgi:hypothetical protein
MQLAAVITNQARHCTQYKPKSLPEIEDQSMKDYLSPGAVWLLVLTLEAMDSWKGCLYLSRFTWLSGHATMVFLLRSIKDLS